MQHSILLSKILDTAEQIKTERGFNCISASLILAVCSEFRYHSYKADNESYYPERFEEERLRYAYKKLFRIGGNLRSPILSKIENNRSELDIPFDFTLCEQLAISREKTCLSADLVFLCAIIAIPPQHLLCNPEYREYFDVRLVLSDIDANIYDFVIELLSNLQEKLQTRIDAVTKLRNWRPADKFAEPDELAYLLSNLISTKIENKILQIKIPSFFNSNDLTLSIYRANDTFYVHDNGCAIKELRSQLKDEATLHTVLNKVCDKQWIVNGRITGVFSQAYHLTRYLQYLIFIANADLYHNELEEMIYTENSFVKSIIDEGVAEDFNHTKLLEEFRGLFRFGYDENTGLYLSISTTFARFSTQVSFLIETLKNGMIRISDFRKGKFEGEIFESFYWSNDNIVPYKDYIEKIAKRFGAKFVQKNIYLTDRNGNFFPALFRFINTAVLLSEFGNSIKLPPTDF